MSETHDDCTRFEDWLLGEPQRDVSRWHSHLEACRTCREQWAAHQMLAATFAGEAVPELSPAFQAGLDRKLETAVRVTPLRGWRLAALAAYALAAAGLFGWVLDRFPLPTVDTSSPWVSVAALVAVPLTLWLTAAATRLLPVMGRRRGAPSANMLLL